MFLMWPETEERLGETMRDMTRRAASRGRTIDYGLRIHVIVRETEEEAREAARALVSRLDDGLGGITSIAEGLAPIVEERSRKKKRNASGGLKQI